LGERILIGEDCWITVVDVDRHSGRVRLAFEFPKDITIAREEVSGKKYSPPPKHNHD
jgi:carbon storage regulator CsrA